MMGSKQPSPDEIARVEERVSRALRAQADRVQPSVNAYARLAERVAAAKASGPRRTLTHWARPVGFVAVTLAAVGLGAYAIAQQGSQAVDTIDAAPATADASDLFDGAEADSPTDSDDSDAASEPGGDVATAVPDDDDPAVDDLAGTVDGPSGDGVDSAEDITGGGYGVEARTVDIGATYAPVKSTELGAAQAFLDLLDIDFAVPELEAGNVVVRSLAEGGQEPGPVISTLTVEEVAGGYLVTEAGSDLVDFDLVNVLGEDPSDDDIDDPAAVEEVIEIRGVGADVGRSLAFELRSAVDGATINVDAEATVTSDEAGGFSVSLPIVGSERAWIVVTSTASSSDNGDGDDGTGMAPAFAARSVLYTGPPKASTTPSSGLRPTTTMEAW